MDVHFANNGAAIYAGDIGGDLININRTGK